MVATELLSSMIDTSYVKCARESFDKIVDVEMWVEKWIKDWVVAISFFNERVRLFVCSKHLVLRHSSEISEHVSSNLRARARGWIDSSVQKVSNLDSSTQSGCVHLTVVARVTNRA